MPKLAQMLLERLHSDINSDEPLRMNAGLLQDMQFPAHNVEVSLNDALDPHVADLLCTSANLSAPTARKGVEFCPCVQTGLTIGHPHGKACIVLPSSEYGMSPLASVRDQQSSPPGLNLSPPLGPWA